MIEIARALGGVPADIPGLWWIPGHPELTTGQVMQVARDHGFAVRARLLGEG